MKIKLIALPILGGAMLLAGCAGFTSLEGVDVPVQGGVCHLHEQRSITGGIAMADCPAIAGRTLVGGTSEGYASLVAPAIQSAGLVGAAGVVATAVPKNLNVTP